MKGDFSRIVFDRRNHYAGVLHQQGRVWLDSDWNEDVFERLDQLQQETLDIVGPCGVPAPGTAFQIIPGADPAHPENFSISGGDDAKGRAYVKGLLCRTDGPTTYFTQPDLPDPPPIVIPRNGGDTFAIVYLEAWRRLVTYLEDPSVSDVALGGPDTATRVKIISQVKALVVPQGTVCADLPSLLPPDNGTLTTLQPKDSQPPDLCSLPDPANYTGRENHFYRVEVHTGGDVLVTVGGPGLTLNVLLGQNSTAGSTSLTLSAVLTSDQIASIQRWGSVLTINDDDGRAEQIQIATVTAAGNVLVLASPLANSFTTTKHARVLGLAEFKWSRDNAIYAAAVTSVAGDRQTLMLSSLGRDQASALRDGDIVEVSDDASELGPARGHLTYISGDPDADLLKVTIADPLPPRFRLSTDPNPPATDRHLILRRWDGRGVARDRYDDSGTPDMNLGNGVHIQFGGQNLRPGDYWNFTARSVDGSVQPLSQAPPNGITRYYCPLALVRWTPVIVGSPPASPPPSSDYEMEVVEDCRRKFNPLTEIPGAEPGMHIVGLFALNAATGGRAPLLNDQVFNPASLSGGIDIVLDRNVDPVSVQRPTCFVTVEIPFTAQGQAISAPVVAYQTLSVVGVLNTRGRIISWRPSTAAGQVLAQVATSAGGTDKGILCRLTLKGNFIWSLGNSRLYLDGDNFGAPKGRLTRLLGTPAGILTPQAGTSLPSGDKRRGGDFETWFWIVAPPKTGDKLSDKTSDKTAEKSSEKAREKTAEKLKEKTRDKTKEKISEKAREKTSEKLREKITEKSQDKIKDRDLAPLHPGASTKLLDTSPQLLGDSDNPPEGRAFITPEERPDVGQALLEDKTRKGARR